MNLLRGSDSKRYEKFVESARADSNLDITSIETFSFFFHVSQIALNSTDDNLATFNMSKARFMVLLLLHRHSGPPLTPAELAQSLEVTRATVSGLLETLEHSGYVQRTFSSADRRNVEVRITASGQELLDRILQDGFKRMAAYMKDFSSEEKNTLVQLLSKLKDAVAEVHSVP